MKIHDYENGKFTQRKSTDLDRNRTRFNFGYHDGSSNFKRKWNRPDNLTIENIREKHFDTVYALGYVYGYNDARLGAYEGNSSQAWLVAIAEKQVIDGITDYNMKNLKATLKAKGIEIK